MATEKPFIARKGLVVESNTLYAVGGKLAVNSGTATVSLEVHSNDAIQVPVGNTSNRPSGANGYFRYNSETAVFEGYSNGVWGTISGNTVTIGGSNTYLLFNDSGVSNGTANVTYTKSTGVFKVSGTVDIASANVKHQVLADGATVTWNIANGQVATLTIGGNRTMASPTNMKVGTYILHVIQDGTGSRTISWNSVFKWPAGVAPVLTTNASARDVMSFVCDGTYMYGSYLPDVK